MKRLLTITFFLMAVMSIHAQEICVFNSDNEMNLNDEVGTAIDAGTIIGQTESIVAKTGASDTYRAHIRPFVIEGTEYIGGLQGSTNPTDADGVAPNLSLKQPIKGAFLKFEAKADGFLYVIIRASSHKAYTVFKDGMAIGYTFAAYGNQWPLPEVYKFNLNGGGIFNYLSDAGIDKVEFAEQEYLKVSKKTEYDARWNTLEDETKEWNIISAIGLAVIKFPVNKGCNYIVNANGSKIVPLGFAFCLTDYITIKSTAITIMDGGVASQSATNTQEIYVFNQNNEMNLDGENGTGITKGTTIGQTESIVAKTGANDFYKPNLHSIVIGDTEYWGGLQGSINPTDVDGVAPNLSLKQPENGAFLKFEAKADGFLSVIIRVSSNKAYTVFEEGTAIGYTFAAYGNEWPLPEVYQYTLTGGGEYNYLSEAGIKKVEFAEQEYLKAHNPEAYNERWSTLEDGTKVWDDIIAYGLGVIKFRVYKDCDYIVNANGSKITPLGFVFNTEEDVTVKIKGKTIWDSSKLPDMTIDAQEFVVINHDNILNLNENGTDLFAGTVIGESYNIVAKISADNYKPYGRTFSVNGTEYWGGLQGSNNPKDADGIAPNISFAPPIVGSYLEIEAKANGYLNVIIYASSNKAYTVFEDGKAIGYTFAAQSQKPLLPEFYQFTIKGGGESNYLSEAGINKVELAEQEYLKASNKEEYDARWSTTEEGLETWNPISSHGIGFIRFRVKAGCNYIVNANGSKILPLGFAFNTEDNTDIKSGYQTVMLSGDTPQCATPTINFENGVLSFSCTTPGVTYVTKIANEEINTAYGKEIKLSKSLNISVYATKTNYAQSETATTEIEFDAGSNLKGDVNKDGVVNVADHVELSKIIMKQEE